MNLIYPDRPDYLDRDRVPNVMEQLRRVSVRIQAEKDAAAAETAALNVAA